MDKYRRVEKKDEEAAAAAPIAEPNEVRITQQGAVRSYVTYANGLFQDKNETKVVVKAMGYAISKAVTVAEVLKHRVVGLHQLTRIGSIETVDVYEPLEEGLDRVEQKRRLPSITITLSLEPLDTSDPGYQPPIAAELVTPQLDEKDLPEKPKRQPKGEKKTKKDKPKKQATAAATAAAAGDVASPPPSDRDEDKQVSAEDTKESKPARGNSSKRGGRGGGRGRGRGRGSGADGVRGGDASAKGDAAARAASVSPVRKSHEPATDKDDAPSKKRQPKKKRAVGEEGDANKTAVDRAAETTTDNNHGDDAVARENGGGRGRGRGGRGRGRGRGRGGRGDGGRGEGKATSNAAAAVVAEA